MSVRMYWEEKTYYSNIADITPRPRYKAIKSVFHISFNKDLEGKDPKEYDKLFKFCQLYDHVQKNCQDIPPEENNFI